MAVDSKGQDRNYKKEAKHLKKHQDDRVEHNKENRKRGRYGKAKKTGTALVRGSDGKLRVGKAKPNQAAGARKRWGKKTKGHA